jgi:hypothetical protein
MSVEHINIRPGYQVVIDGEWARLEGPAGTVFDVKSEDGHPRLRDFIRAVGDTPETPLQAIIKKRYYG